MIGIAIGIAVAKGEAPSHILLGEHPFKTDASMGGVRLVGQFTDDDARRAWVTAHVRLDVGEINDQPSAGYWVDDRPIGGANNVVSSKLTLTAPYESTVDAVIKSFERYNHREGTWQDNTLKWLRGIRAGGVVASHMLA